MHFMDFFYKIKQSLMIATLSVVNRSKDAIRYLPYVRKCLFVIDTMQQ